MGFTGDIRHLPNFIDLDQFPTQALPPQRSFVYFGRLAAEKGLRTLLTAAAGLPATVKIIGDGPQRAELESLARQQAPGKVLFLGYLRGADLQREVQQSLAVIQPSEWYENNPLSVLEAFACGKPVIGSNLGGIPELIQDGRTGLTFTAGQAEELRARMAWLLERPEQAAAMGQTARDLVREKYNEESHAAALLGIYRDAAVKYT
jgi:glycosyltransferase involved in cell wall biosynthesis